MFAKETKQYEEKRGKTLGVKIEEEEELGIMKKKYKEKEQERRDRK